MELKEELIPHLSAYSKKKGLLFSATPFYLDAVDILNPHVDFFKIASYELLWKELFIKCANTEKPLVFSTGMCIPEEINSALDSIKDSKVKEILILHCNSSYPTPLSDVNLNTINTLRESYKNYIPDKIIEFGWSDHTVNSSVMLSSILKYNSKMIEFHIDLDGKGFEFEAGHCWLPGQISNIIRTVSEAFAAEGNGKVEPSNSEIIEREWRADPSDGLRPLLHVREELLSSLSI